MYFTCYQIFKISLILIQSILLSTLINVGNDMLIRLLEHSLVVMMESENPLLISGYTNFIYLVKKKIILVTNCELK